MFPVLADNTVLTSVKALIENQEAPSYFRNSSFAQLIELLVLADLIYVDDMSFRISKTGGFLSSLNPGLTNIVTGLEVSDADRASAVSFAQQSSKSIGYQFSNDGDELHPWRGLVKSDLNKLFFQRLFRRPSSIGVHLQRKAPVHRSSTIICCYDRDGVVALWACINDGHRAISRVYT